MVCNELRGFDERARRHRQRLRRRNLRRCRLNSRRTTIRGWSSGRTGCRRGVGNPNRSDRAARHRRTRRRFVTQLHRRRRRMRSRVLDDSANVSCLSARSMIATSRVLSEHGSTASRTVMLDERARDLPLRASRVADDKRSWTSRHPVNVGPAGRQRLIGAATDRSAIERTARIAAFRSIATPADDTINTTRELTRSGATRRWPRNVFARVQIRPNRTSCSASIDQIWAKRNSVGTPPSTLLSASYVRILKLASVGSPSGPNVCGPEGPS